VKSSRAALDQLRTLLSKAKTIGEVLSVEREISVREADLESLQARQKALAAQTASATLTLHLVGPAAVVIEPEPDQPGFLSGLKSGWNALVSTTKVALNIIGVLLPWLVVLGLLWLAFTPIRRRVRPRIPATARRAAPDTAGAPKPDAPSTRAVGPDAHEQEVTAPPVPVGARGTAATPGTGAAPENTTTREH
jgi:hypothetical protein